MTVVLDPSPTDSAWKCFTFYNFSPGYPFDTACLEAYHIVTLLQYLVKLNMMYYFGGTRLQDIQNTET